jgi:hypothetical protein
MGSVMMLLRYGHHLSIMVTFPDKCEQQNRFNPDNKGGLVCYTDRSKTNKSIGAGVYRWSLRRGHSFSLGLHTMVFQTEIYTLKVV